MVINRAPSRAANMHFYHTKNVKKIIKQFVFINCHKKSQVLTASPGARTNLFKASALFKNWKEGLPRKRRPDRNHPDLRRLHEHKLLPLD